MSSVINPHAGMAAPRPRMLVSSGLIALLLLLLGSAFVAEFRQREWEFPIIRAVNSLARHSMLLDRTMHALTTRDLLQGVPFIAVIWFLWFSAEDLTTRASLLVGTIAASGAGIISRLMQLGLPTHFRPLHQATIGFVPPYGVESDVLNHFNSFPSDHGAVYFALCAVIWRVRPRLGLAAFIWAAVIDLARVYEGYHFPSDVAGSAAVGLLVLYSFQGAAGWRITARVLAFERNQRPWFYMFAFLLTFQFATLFDDLRQIGRGFSMVLLHHDMFNGP